MDNPITLKIILLVVIFCHEKFPEGNYLRLNPSPLIGLKICCIISSSLLLHWIMKEKNGGVLPSEVSREGIVIVPEYIKQLSIRDHGRVKINLDSLRVIPNTTVSRVLACTSSVADTSPYYTIKAPEPGVRPPESAHGESGGLVCICLFHIYRRNMGLLRLRHLGFTNPSESENREEYHNDKDLLHLLHPFV